MRCRRDDVLHEFKPFGDHASVKVRQPRDIAARAREAGHQPDPNRIGNAGHDDGESARRLFGSLGRRGIPHDEDIDLEMDEVRCQVGEPCQLSCRIPPLDEDVGPLYIAQLVQPLLQTSEPGLVAVSRGRREKPESRDVLWLLRLGGKRRRKEGKGKHRNEPNGMEPHGDLFLRHAILLIWCRSG